MFPPPLTPAEFLARLGLLFEEQLLTENPSPAEVDAALCALGYDPDELAARICAVVEQTLARVREQNWPQ